MKNLNVEQLNNYYNKSDKCHICERRLDELPPVLENKFKIIKNLIDISFKKSLVLKLQCVKNSI